ncbi:MAG: DUF4194 domain-containing protein [Actinobacteria bacterium]|nr:DUF4194 domain-containing protein [Actinomycetota bacterium]
MSESATKSAEGPPDLSLVLIQLFKGPLYRDTHEKLWEPLLKLRAPVSDHVGVLGLIVEVDENEGYAFLRSRPTGEDEVEMPRLVARRTLPFHVSVLLALLRKRLAEFDAANSDTRLILSREQIVEMMRLFLAESTNDARLVDTIDAHINKVVELGFLRRLRGEAEQFEVRRILRAFVDGHWLSDFDRELDEYLVRLGRSGESE